MSDCEHAFWLLAQHDIYRYLFCNTKGRLNGYEKAIRHNQITNIFVALVKRVEIDQVHQNHFELQQKIHDYTQALTSYMDREIGFPIDNDRPDYDTLAKKFSKRFFKYACEALEKYDAK